MHLHSKVVLVGSEVCGNVDCLSSSHSCSNGESLAVSNWLFSVVIRLLVKEPSVTSVVLVASGVLEMSVVRVVVALDGKALLSKILDVTS